MFNEITHAVTSLEERVFHHPAPATPIASEPKGLAMSTPAVVQLGATPQSVSNAATTATAVVSAPAPKETFFEKVEGFFKKVLGSTTWERTAGATLTLVAPLVETIATLTAGEPASLLIAGVINEVQSDLAVAATLIGQANSTPTLAGVLTAVKTNLGSLLSAAHIKDSTTQSKVLSIVSTVVAEIEAIQKVIPAAA